MLEFIEDVASTMNGRTYVIDGSKNVDEDVEVRMREIFKSAEFVVTFNRQKVASLDRSHVSDVMHEHWRNERMER